jgi:hypothetical protein
VYSSIRPAESFSWAGITSENLLPILCKSHRIAHQLASARKKNGISGEYLRPGFNPMRPHRCTSREEGLYPADAAHVAAAEATQSVVAAGP